MFIKVVKEANLNQDGGIVFIKVVSRKLTLTRMGGIVFIKVV